MDELLLLLQKLDRLLEGAIAKAEFAYGAGAATNPYQGLQINSDEVARLLDQQPGMPILGSRAAVQEFSLDQIGHASHLSWLSKTFQLSDFDLAVVMIAIAPELDRRYERLYAYLQDDVRCKRPTVDLSLNLLCSSAMEKLIRQACFTGEAPLIHHGLLEMIPDPNQPAPSLLAHIIKLNPQVTRLLLGDRALDQRLVSCCRLVTPQIHLDDLPLGIEVKRSLPALVKADWHASQSLTLYFHGADQSGKRHVAEALAHTLQVSLLVVDLAVMLEAQAQFRTTLKLLLREALFQHALLYIDNLERLQTSETTKLYQFLLDQVVNHPQVIILSGTQSVIGTTSHIQGILTIPFPMPGFEQRQFYWSYYLQTQGICLDSQDLDRLSDRFQLTSEQIANAVFTTKNEIRYRESGSTNHTTSFPSQGQIKLSDLFAAAREVSGHSIAVLAQRIQPKYGWEDIVLPAFQKTQVREICDQVKFHHLVWEKWGFERQRSLGKGLNALFTGSPGTGKTMAAEVIAQELQLDLYKIDLSQIVSKYIGETEKNLNRIFAAAANANAILLFDEADALFGKRSEVKDAHDRYANLEISYLLQKMEEYEGLAILTTNLRSNIDDAFVRRLRFIIEFPFPAEKQRYQIWQNIFPKLAPCSPDLDLSFLAHQFELTGANIRNIALTAAFLAAAGDSQIEMAHIMQAVRREYQKMGKILKDN
ncbi:MAG: ATP-binding protein [Synechococcales bacterium]|nr:ATP-binding protein [Synechococcales bacterium]